MEITIALIIIIALIVLIQKYKKPNKTAKPLYRYFAKHKILTDTELTFYRMLLNATNDKYAIIPQAHLSTFLSEKIKGQNWLGAFFAINGKSVDFLLCEKSNLKPLIAIELDDFTHHRPDRIERDKIVNEIIGNSNIRLVRFNSYEWGTEQAILNKIEYSMTSQQEAA